MSGAVTSRVADALHELARRIHQDPSRDSVWTLVQALAAHRRSCSLESWRTFCETLEDHPIVSLLLDDPYTRDARLKAAGYAGDARTLDYVYLRDVGTQAVGDLGRALFRVTTSVPIADAVRGRALSLGQVIEAQADRAGEPVRVASIACGHLRELDHVSSGALRRLAVWGVDQDPLSVERCAARFGGLDVTARVGSVRDLLIGRARIPDSSLIYASGLFDYLDDRAASLLIRRMTAALRPGGTVLIPNLTPFNNEIAYMEAVMDWWMNYRTIDDVVRLAHTARLEPGVKVDAFTSAGGHVAWLHLTRPGPS
jgi:hypothetical protein